MRLSKIKLAGFKSFVDPTTFELRSNLTAIVGPNGCGKSNTIDAVRWVMGESSAKHLRGASMEDVIFNGSSTRKKVGQASVELVFDNSDGSLGGEYANFTEIATKRQISRDGQSKYFLNGSRCRRRDITDIFLGTGLGPRSYAIIEQGMISRLIDAKPEELRVYIEEAAGISKYKERRRETENRIRATRDNLDRLTDLREEIDKQISTLKRQASAAARFKDYKQEERRLAAELLYLQLTAVTKELKIQQDQINLEANELQAHLTEQRSLENQLETNRVQQTESNSSFNQVQASVYEAGAAVSNYEQQIKHQHEIVERDRQQRDQLTQELASARLHLQHDEQRLVGALNSLELLEPQAEEVLDAKEIQESKLQIANVALSSLNQEWSQLQQKMAEPARQVSVEASRIQQLEQQISRNQLRLQRIEQQQHQSVDSTNETLNVEAAKEQQLILTGQLAAAEEQLNLDQQTFTELQQKQQSLQQQQNQLRSTLQRNKGRLSSLETLQQAGLGKDKSSLKKWLAEYKLDNLPRLAEQIKVDAKWEAAVEQLLGPTLEALSLPEPKQLKHIVNAGCSETIELIVSKATKTANDSPFAANSLAHHIQQPIELKRLLAAVYCVDDHLQALAKQETLKPGEQLITPDGSCYTSHWVRLNGNKQPAKDSGVLARQKEIDSLHQQITVDESALEQTDSDLQQAQEVRKTLQATQLLLRQQQQRLHRSESEANAKLQSMKQQKAQEQQYRERIAEEIAELNLQQEQDAQQLIQSQETMALSEAQTEQLTESIELLKDQQQGMEEAVSSAHMGLQTSRDQYQSLQIQLETQRNNSQVSQQQLNRVTDQIEALQVRQLTQTEAQPDAELIASLQGKLDLSLQDRQSAEVKLTGAREALSNIELVIREKETTRTKAEAKVSTQREKIEVLKLNWQGINVRAETLQEQLDETEFEAETLQLDLDPDAQIESHQKQLEIIRGNVHRLGAINLAAIEEYDTQSERKVYLDQQNEDLSEALETLESAIRTIDKDTRGRFKDTFEKVNERIQEMFPRLFGGGEAHLEMTGDDLLTTGVSIMARPPGKRISSIQLMSGGEKALTAAAMVFAIFELNPAPFCMLDEVDAPLDEANVGRFCELVKHMSKRVQFIFITHNKSTMEMAENLIGVTMREPGVSRMVAVDVNAAARMIQE